MTFKIFQKSIYKSPLLQNFYTFYKMCRVVQKLIDFPKIVEKFCLSSFVLILLLIKINKALF